MFKKINDVLAGLPMTLAAGVFLLFDLVPHVAAQFGAAWELNLSPFDPAWAVVVVCGLPLLYLAVCDGYHVGTFVDLVREYVSAFPAAL